ncbi:hypothetical protein CsatB_020984 [Cannabis sativa]
MIPPATHSAGDGGSPHWKNTPIPYLFGGLALMLGLITVALIILACSYRKSSSSSSSSPTAVGAAGGGDDDDDLKRREIDEVVVDCDEPKFVVIMAGDHNPTYLANPLNVSSTPQSFAIEQK